MLHLSDNTKHKAVQLQLPPAIIVKLVKHFSADVLQCSPQNFTNSVEQATLLWLGQAKLLSCEDSVLKLISYCKRSVLPGILGNLLQPDCLGGGFLTNNVSESMNVMLKSWRGPTRLPIDEFCIRLKEGVIAQQEELKKVAVGISRRFIEGCPESDVDKGADISMEDEVFTVSSSTQKYSPSLIKPMTAASNKCQVTKGIDAYMVKYGTEKEYSAS